MREFRLGALLFMVVCVARLAHAQSSSSDLPGAKDHPLVGRYAGSVLQHASEENYASVRVPGGPGRPAGAQLAFAKETKVEGHISAYFYVAPRERSALEVFRNYESALRGAGFVALFSCELRACDDA